MSVSSARDVTSDGSLRPRAEDREELADLPLAIRRRVGEIWAHRARSEQTAGSAFAQVVARLEEIGAAPVVLDLGRQAIRDERRHADTCLALAGLYLDEAVAMPAPSPAGLPPHRGASDALRTHLHLIGLSCINETIASSFAALCLDHSEVSFVRRAESQHLRDEIGHARLGWAHLGSGVLDRRDRAALERWLPRLIKANGEHWLSRMATLPEAGVVGHAYPPRGDLVSSVRTALVQLVVPGFAACGFDVTKARDVAQFV